jgi:predicted glutamine amidotransferase
MRRIPKEILLDFLEEKIDNNNNFPCSYGLSWRNDTSWNNYKQSIVPEKDKNLKNIFENINSNIIISHIREITKKFTQEEIELEINIDNTHPFIYKENTFFHHGDLMYTKNNKCLIYQKEKNNIFFKKLIIKLKKNISQELLQKITGNTDSELMFYLFLSIFEKIKKEFDFSIKKLLLVSFYRMLQLINSYEFDNISNIIFTNNNYILIANVYRVSSTNNKKNNPLYINLKNGIIITSVKKDSYKTLKDNQILLIDINNDKIYKYIIPSELYNSN